MIPAFYIHPKLGIDLLDNKKVAISRNPLILLGSGGRI